jgi:two-component system response regulator
MKKQANILLVEDNKADQTIIERALEDGKISCLLTIAHNGQEALDQIEALKKVNDLPDLILMDINMPIMDGKQTLKKIRSDDSIKHIPIIMLTTSTRDKDVMESYQLGVNAYLSKPIENDDFMHTIRQIENFWFDLVVLPKES